MNFYKLCNTLLIVVFLFICLKIYEELNYLYDTHEKAFNTSVNLVITEESELDKFIKLDKQLTKIINKSNPKLDNVKKEEYKKWIIYWSSEYELEPLLIASIIHRETNYKENAVSRVKARGPMQVMYKVHKDKCDKFNLNEQDLHTIEHGIHIGCIIIKDYLKQTNGNYKQALYKYVGAVKNKQTGEVYSSDILRMIEYAKEC